MPQVLIKHRWTDAVLYTHETTAERQASGLAMRDALEAACKARANLADANLADAYLADAKLADAYLADANLAGAYLAGANLADANLAGANLADANLADAYLADANLAGAYLAGAKVRGHQLVGDRPFLQISPIGSRCAQMTLWLTKEEPYIQTGCFFGTRNEFEAAVSANHGYNNHGNEYTAALVLIDAHTSLWMPAEVEAAK